MKGELVCEAVVSDSELVCEAVVSDSELVCEAVVSDSELVCKAVVSDSELVCEAVVSGSELVSILLIGIVIVLRRNILIQVTIDAVFSLFFGVISAYYFAYLFEFRGSLLNILTYLGGLLGLIQGIYRTWDISHR